MNKVKIKLVSIGHLPLEFQSKKVENWKSSTFEIVDEIDNFALRCDSDVDDWAFSDALVKNQLPVNSGSDFMIAIVNVPIEDNWYSRRLGDNQIVFTFHQINEILEHYNIPLENVIYRLLYSYTLLYRRAGNKIPDFSEAAGFTHDETRGCLFDMNGIKTDLVLSCHNPKVCDECQERLKQERVSHSDIENTQKDIKRIKKDLYYRIIGLVKKQPIWALVLSSLFALLLGTSGSIIGSYTYTYLTSGTVDEQGIPKGSSESKTEYSVVATRTVALYGEKQEIPEFGISYLRANSYPINDKTNYELGLEVRVEGTARSNERIIYIGSRLDYSWNKTSYRIVVISFDKEAASIKINILMKLKNT
jgi:hypothetical protein